MKVKNLRIKQPDTQQVVVEMEEIDAPVGEILELIKSGIIDAVKNALNQ